MASPILEFLNGAGAPVELDEVLVVGRAETCGLRLEDPGVAAQHLRITRDLVGVVWAEALAPGVKRSGKPLIIRQALVDGDELQVGGVTLRFRSGEADERTEMTTLPTELTHLGEDDSDPHTTQMDPADLETLAQAQPAKAAVAHEGPAPLPPPPTAALPLVTNPAIPLPPPPPMPSTDPFLAAPPVDGSTGPPRPTHAAGFIQDEEEAPTLSQPRREPAEPPTRQIELPPSARKDPTTQPSLRTVALPPHAGNLRRAGVFVRALWDGPARAILMMDLAWSAPAGALLGLAVLLGGPGRVLLLAGLAVVGVLTLTRARRVSALLDPAGALTPVVAQPPGVDPALIGVTRLRLGLGALVAAGVVLAFSGWFGALVGGALAAGAMAAQAWLGAAYGACLSAWARACPIDQMADPQHAPAPLKKALAS